MTPVLRPLFAAALAAAPLAAAAQPHAPAEGDGASALLELFSLQRLSRISIQWMIGGLRTELPVTYQALSVSADGREAYLTGVALAPAPPWDVNGECRVTADRVELSETGGPDDFSVHVEVAGAAATPQCLEPEAADALAVAGFDRLAMDRLYLDLDYRFGPSTLRASLHAAIRDALVVEAAADFAYVWAQRLPAPFPAEDPFFLSEPQPVADLAGLEIRIEDAGAVAALRRAAPTLEIDLDALPAQIEAGLRGVLSGPGDRSLSADLAAFLGNLRLAASRFLAEGGALTVSAAPARPVRIRPDAMERPAELVERLAPEAAAGPVRARAAVDPALLAAAARGEADALTDAEKRAAGRRLMLDLGGPAATAAGRALLAPLAEAGDADAAAILAEALAETAPAEAYRHALAAAALPGGLARLDAIEIRLPLGEVLAAQATLGAARPEAQAADDAAIADADLGAIRRRALGYVLGETQPRDYRRAYALASLAAAAGDRASIDLRARLTRRLTDRGDADAALWRETAAALADEALGVWIEGGLAERLAP